MSTHADRCAVAEDGCAVAEAGDLEHAVRDEDDRPLRPVEAGNGLEHPGGEVGGQRGRHLVEQEHVRLDGQGTRQVDHAQGSQRQMPAMARRSSPPIPSG